MPSPEETRFALISVHADDEEELVVHAGSPAAGSSRSVPGDPDSGQGPARPVSPPEPPAPGGASADPGRERFLRRVDELERAESGLEDPKAFAGARRVVLAVLALIAIAFVAYMASRAGGL